MQNAAMDTVHTEQPPVDNENNGGAAHTTNGHYSGNNPDTWESDQSMGASEESNQDQSESNQKQEENEEATREPDEHSWSEAELSKFVMDICDGYHRHAQRE